MARKHSHTTGRTFLPGEDAARAALLHAGVGVARAQRRRLSGTTFVGITGSAGKTTAKKLTVAILGGEGSVVTHPRGSNRLSRVARTVLRTRPGDDFCVLEVAAWRPGSVAEIARVVQPDRAVVTRIGLDHHREFRSLEAVAEEKGALVAALAPDGIAVLNADDPHAIGLAALAPGRVVTFGEGVDATLRAENLRSTWPEPLAFTLRVEGREFPVATRLHGKHTATAVLASLAVVYSLGIPLERALDAVAEFEAETGRMSVLRAGGITVVRDDIKAPSWALEPPLAWLADARAERKVLIAGTISDYAGSSSAVYRRIARRALEVADLAVFVGPNAHNVRHVVEQSEGRLRWFETVPAAIEHLAGELRDGDLVLLEGSHRADHLSRIPLSFVREVRCDREDCRRIKFCDGCDLLATPGTRRRLRAGGAR